MAVDAERWNHNIEYHSVVLGAVPAHAGTALDVGCGEGMLTRRLAQDVATVVGIDTHRPSIEHARDQARGQHIGYIVGDVLTHPLDDETFDFIASVASLHHMDADAGLQRMRSLLRPGGRLVVLGLARSSSLRDVPYEVAGLLAHRAHSPSLAHWAHPSPTVWPPPETYTSMRRITAALLPGARFRRHALWRYSVVWTKPAG